MAGKDDTGDAFIREVDEEYRREKLGNLWSRYGRLLLLGIGALLLGVAGFLYWQRLQADRSAARADQFATALTQVRAGVPAKAEPTLTALSTAPEPGYRALALLERAGAAAANDPARATQLYMAASTNTDLARPFRDLALLKATALAFDTLSPADVIARLKPMALPGNPWFGTAGELTALAHLKAGEPSLAKPLLDALAKDESVPVSIRGRAGQLAATLAGPATPTPRMVPAAVPATPAAASARSPAK